MNIFELQKQDHRAFLFLVEVILDSIKQKSLHSSLIKELKYSILAHALAEEEVVFIFIKNNIPDYEHLIISVNKDHDKIEKLLNAIHIKNTIYRDFHKELYELKNILIHDINLEENSLYVGLEKVITPIQAEQLAFEMTRRKIQYKKSLFSRVVGKIKQIKRKDITIQLI